MLVCSLVITKSKDMNIYKAGAEERRRLKKARVDIFSLQIEKGTYRKSEFRWWYSEGLGVPYSF